MGRFRALAGCFRRLDYLYQEFTQKHRTDARSDLVERDNELAGLLELARADEGDRGAIALVSGEAGIGKSSLIEHFAAMIGDERAVLIGRSDPLATTRPFGPLYDISRSLSELLQSLEGHGKSRNQVFAAVAAELSKLDRSAVLIFEDLHWIDASTAEFLQYIGRRIADYSFLVVLTYRSDELGQGHPLLSVIGDLPHRRVTRFTLQKLSEDGIAKLAGCSPDRARMVHDLTSGIPFYVCEYLAFGSEVPGSVSEMLAAKLDRLPEEKRSLVQLLSVSPEPVSPVVLKQLAGDQAIEHALGCVDAGMVKEYEDGRLYLCHELARLAVYGSLDETRRRQIHRAYCQALARSNNSATLAIQLHHADAARDAGLVPELAYRAALAAARLGAHAEAYNHACVGLKYRSQADDRMSVELLQLWAGSACVSTCMDDQVVAAREEAARLWHELGEDGFAADNLRWLSRLHWYRCEPDEARDTGMRCVALLRGTGDLRHRALAEALHAQLLFLELEMEEAISRAREAITLSEQSGYPESKVHALNTLGAARCFMGQEGGIEQVRQSIELARNVTYDDYSSRDADIARGFLNLADHAADYRMFDLADEIVTQGCRQCDEIDFELWVMQLTGRRAEVFLEQGRIAEAVRLAEQVLEYEAMTPQASQRVRLVLAKAASRTGDPSAKRQLDECLTLAETSSDAGLEIATRTALVEWSFLHSDEHCANLQLKCLAKIPSHKFHQWHLASFEAWRAFYSGERQSTSNSHLPEPYRLELAGSVPDAFHGFMDADLPFEAVLCLLRSRKSELMEEFRRADELCNSMGATAICKVIERQRGASGGRRRRGPYRSSRSHPLGLTRKELDVLRILGEGATNREIAEQLNRSVRTIDRHVSALLRKLNVSSRVDMVIRLGNEPWILSSLPEDV